MGPWICEVSTLWSATIGFLLFRWHLVRSSGQFFVRFYVLEFFRSSYWSSIHINEYYPYSLMILIFFVVVGVIRNLAGEISQEYAKRQVRNLPNWILWYDMYIYVCVCVCVCVIQVGHALIKNLLKNFFFFGVPYFIVKNSF